MDKSSHRKAETKAASAGMSFSFMFLSAIATHLTKRVPCTKIAGAFETTETWNAEKQLPPTISTARLLYASLQNDTTMILFFITLLLVKYPVLEENKCVCVGGAFCFEGWAGNPSVPQAFADMEFLWDGVCASSLGITRTTQLDGKRVSVSKISKMFSVLNISCHVRFMYPLS